jgi:branched-chain amino acid aminotransferase
MLDMSEPRISSRHLDPRAYPAGVAYMDGQFLPMAEAKISVLDWGFLHSDATYDTVHVWKKRFFRLDLHLDRFLGGLERLHMSIPYSRSRIEEVLHTCAALSGFNDAYVEMICTRGTSPVFSRDPRQAENRFIAFAVPFGWVANEEQRARGLRIAVSRISRIPPQSIDPRIKNYHWLDLVMGLYEAFDRGAETALLQDIEGRVSEGPGFNVFVVSEGRLRTPKTGVLPGITRRTVFDLARKSGIPVEEGDVTRQELGLADEVFITSTAGGIMAVTEVDGAPVAGGAVGPLTSQLTRMYWDAHVDPAWSTPVRTPTNAE